MNPSTRNIEYALAALWLWSGLQPPLSAWDISIVMLQRLPLLTGWAAPLFLAACGLDLAFGLLTLLHPCRALWRAQAAAVAGYSLTLAIWLPENWLHPFAPLMKNLPILAMLLWLGARRETSA